MATPTTVRSGFRMSGPEVPATVYAHPPLVECWLAVDYHPDGQLTETDIQTIRATLGPEWPGALKEVAIRSNSGGWELSNVMQDRAFRVSSHGFAFGWLGYTGERYPRYEAVRDGFVAIYDSLRNSAGHAKPLLPQRWSVRYVNRISRGTVWSTPGDWAFFKLWQPEPLKALGIDAAGYRANWELPLEAERGTLTIDFRHTLPESADEIDSVWLNLTTSGPIDNAESSLFDGLDFGREVIVKGFNELVSANAKIYWGGRSR